MKSEYLTLYCNNAKCNCNNISHKGAEWLLPFLLMDAQYSIVSERIMQLKLSHQQKHSRKLWAQSYNQFNKVFFDSYNETQTEKIIEIMDSFTNSLSNEIVKIRSRVYSIFSRYDHEERIIISDAVVCNILCQCAQIVYKQMFNASDRHIAICERHSNEFSSLVANSKREKRIYNLNEFSELRELIRSFCQKMKQYIINSLINTKL